MIFTQSQLCLIIYLQLPQKYKQVQTIQRFEVACKLKFIITLPTSNSPMTISSLLNKSISQQTLTKLCKLHCLNQMKSFKRNPALHISSTKSFQLITSKLNNTLVL